ncbi:hypothetical protein VNI00_012721 [Paramarasmius palmivorus]|uniref:F-box domain-containing protein n=1 Tax=Paramarasmius palmivorus TaxID=297713 RepID=A0AAW0C4T8_9AGAR
MDETGKDVTMKGVAIEGDLNWISSSGTASSQQRALAHHATFSPIERLPDEVLSSIFVCFAARKRIIKVVFNSSLNRHTYKLGWIVITHVCDMAREMLRRSKGAPLAMAFPRLRGAAWDVILEAATKHLSHTFSLDIAANTRTKELLLLMTQPAPLLTHLSIYRDDEDIFDIPDSFLGNEIPPLKSLHLDGVHVPLDSPLYRNVTNLILRTSNPDFQNHYSTKQWINFLHGMPGLEILELVGVLPRSDSVAPESKEPVHLPHLTNASFSSALPQITNFLQYISMSETAYIRLMNCTFTAVTPTGMVDELALLRPVLAGIASTKQRPIGSLVVSNEERCPCCVFPLLSFQTWIRDTVESDHDSESQYRTGDYYYKGSIRLDVEVSLHGMAFFNADTIMKEMTQSFDLNHLHTLGLETQNDPISTETLRECFGTLPKLRNLSVSQRMIYMFVHAIQVFPEHPLYMIDEDSDDPRDPPQQVFTKLRMLRIHDTDLTHPGSSGQWRAIESMDYWYGFLRIPLPKVLFSQCTLFGQQVAYLREHSMDLEDGCRTVEVDEAGWDEYYRADEPSYSVFGEDD